MSAVLRVYDPGECDPEGVPLAWARCRTCGGAGVVVVNHGVEPGSAIASGICPTCGGHGSLKAAALAGAWQGVGRSAQVRRLVAERGNDVPTLNAIVAEVDAGPVRCEGCGHPMGDGTWENPGGYLDDIAMRDLLAKPYLADGRNHAWAERRGAAHWSPCDERCTHRGPGRATGGQLRGELVGRWLQKAAGYGVVPTPTYKASWRQVDVRTLGWPHDLRPERLAILCLRCWAERSRA